MLKLDGEFSIIKGYGNDMRAAMFSVGNPHKPKNADHFVYTVFVSNDFFYFLQGNDDEG